MRKISGRECILLVDDDPATNFIHKMVIEQAGIDTYVQVASNGREALDYLMKRRDFNGNESPMPGIIFLDINMPKMNGWEFLEVYNELPQEMKARIVMAMLTTSLNPDDANRAGQNENIKGFINKPLKKETLNDIIDRYFAG